MYESKTYRHYFINPITKIVTNILAKVFPYIFYLIFTIEKQFWKESIYNALQL